MIKRNDNFKKLKNHITIMLKKCIYQERSDSICPSCDGEKYIKYGSYNGIQRYKCKKCGKTFSKSTNSLWSYSKKEPTKWIKFVEYVLEQKSIRFCAKKLEISTVTAFYWRHKVLTALKLNSLPNKISGNVYISKKLLPENFKGSRSIPPSIRHNIWIISAKGNEDSFKDRIYFELIISKNASNYDII